MIRVREGTDYWISIDAMIGPGLVDDACLLCCCCCCCRDVPLGPNPGRSTCHGLRKTMGGVRVLPDLIRAVFRRGFIDI